MAKSPLFAGSLELDDAQWRTLESHLSVYWGPRVAPVFDKIRMFRISYQQLQKWLARRQRSSGYIAPDVLAKGEKQVEVLRLYARSIRSKLQSWTKEDPRTDATATLWQQHLEEVLEDLERAYQRVLELAGRETPTQLQGLRADEARTGPGAKQPAAPDVSNKQPAPKDPARKAAPAPKSREIALGESSREPLRLPNYNEGDTVSLADANADLPGIPLNADGLISLAGLHSAKDAQASQPATPRTVRTTPASTTASSGRKIGNYEIKKLIGKGGMGSVFLAEHPHLGRRVAIKTLAPHLATYEEQVARFAAEAKAIAQIEHSNVVEIFDFGQSEDNELYFVMELLDGPNLADIIADKAPMSQATVLEYARQLCAALKAAHDCGVVHRDFKPENVVVVSQEPLFLKVVDFGLAKFYEEPQQGNSRTATGMVMGTPLTIAPEQAAGHPQLIAPATDIYSLAVVLFWMLTGEPPFDDEVAAVLLAKHIRERAPRLTEKRGDVSKALSDLVADCMHKDPRQRPQRTEAVLEGLISAIGEQSEDSRETTPTSQRSKTPRSSTTTLRRATGETQRIERESNGRGRFYTALFTIAAAIIGAALIIANREPRVPKPPTALSQPIKQLPPPYKPPPAVKKVELMVMLSDTRARCRYRIANGELRSQKPPCVIKAKAGQRLELEVARKGMRSFKKQLVLEANQTLRLRRKGRRYLLKETHAGKR